MGELKKHPIGRWRTRFQLGAMVETGCWRGDGVLAGLRTGYPVVHTIDVDPAAFQRMAKRVRAHLGESYLRHVETHLGDSAEVVSDLAETLEVPVLWWLDAHYPEQYNPDAEGTKLPLIHEVEAIVSAGRKHDVLLMDDLRIYGARGQSGPLPERGSSGAKLEPGSREELEYIVEVLSLTHRVTFDRRDGVYLVAKPLADVK